MFNKTFYPTPQRLADRLAEMLGDLTNAYVLDPSAGKGDLLDAVQRRFCRDQFKRPRLYAVEIDPNLRAILYSKDYPIVGEDFLVYWPVVQLTHIIMNPPFDAAEDHLLHAWDILVRGKIVSIFPKTGLEGKTVKERLVMNLIASYGSVEDIGRPFAVGAERAADVECVIVTLEKQPEKTMDEFGFGVRNEETTPDFSGYTGGEVTLNSFIGDLLAAYQASVTSYERYNRERERITRYVEPFAHYYDGRQSRDPLQEADREIDPTSRYNVFVELVTASAWTRVLDHPSFQRLLTNRARQMLNEFLRKQKRVDFNEHNVRAMFAHLMAQQDRILDAAITDAFDTMTRWHKDNREEVEGWLSNEAHQVKRRCIIPFAVRRDWDGFRVEYRREEELNDIDRALCIVGGRPYEQIVTICSAIQTNACGQEATSTHFRLRWWNKGTVHLYWLDENLRREFNIAAARGKGWLPPAKGRN